MKIALIVHACDRYQLLYKAFHYFFHKHWDFNAPINYYFATEEIDVELSHFNNIKSGKGEWSDRLRKILEGIEEEYVLYFQEDMWLSKPLPAHFFHNLLTFVKSNKPPLIKLHSSEVYQNISTETFINGLNISKLDNVASNFLMSHQVSLWNKKFLLEQMKPNEHPWRNERRGTKRLKKLNPPIYHIDLFSENGKPAINKNQEQGEANRSAYSTVSVNGMLFKNAIPYIDQLIADPSYTTYGQLLQKHYKEELTHDGKEKPRKEDVFQKMKKWFRK